MRKTLGLLLLFIFFISCSERHSLPYEGRWRSIDCPCILRIYHNDEFVSLSYEVNGNRDYLAKLTFENDSIANALLIYGKQIEKGKVFFGKISDWTSDEPKSFVVYIDSVYLGTFYEYPINKFEEDEENSFRKVDLVKIRSELKN